MLSFTLLHSQLLGLFRTADTSWFGCPQLPARNLVYMNHHHQCWWTQVPSSTTWVWQNLLLGPITHTWLWQSFWWWVFLEAEIKLIASQLFLLSLSISLLYVLIAFKEQFCGYKPIMLKRTAYYRNSEGIRVISSRKCHVLLPWSL